MVTIKTVSQLLRCRREDLLEIRSFGESSLDQVADALYKLGYEEEWRRFAFPGIPLKEVAEALEDPNSVLTLDMDAHVRYKLFRSGIRTVSQVEKLAIRDLMKMP